MRIKFKGLLKEINCDEILNFLNNPSNELNYYLISKRFFNIEFTSNDLLEYLNYRDNKQYTKIVTIPVDEIDLKPMTGIFDSRVVYLYNLDILINHYL